jgi:endothelin-converting enzyme
MSSSKKKIQEVYNDQETVDIYEKTIERLLLTFFESDNDGDGDSDGDDDEKSSVTHVPPLQISEENGQTWPPWPWPPWDGGKDKEPVNKTKRAHDLAREVIKFETQIAEASLDACVLLLHSSTMSHLLLSFCPLPAKP